MAAENLQMLFDEYAAKYLRGIVESSKEYINGKDIPLTYLHRELLDPKFTRTGTYESIQVYNTRVMADFVTLNADVPLKKRDRISKASGKLVKSGARFQLNEQQIQDIRDLLQAGDDVPESEIIARIFDDMPKALAAEPELMEYCFLKGLSSGSFVINDEDTEGIGVEVDYGYLDSQKFKCTELWSSAANAKPLTDLRNMVKYAKKQGRDINYVYMDDDTFDKFCFSNEVKQFYGYSMGFAGDKTIIQPPSLEQINNALKRDNKYQFTIRIIDRTVILEKNGVQTTLTPWESGKVIGTQGLKLGNLFWSNVVEQFVRDGNTTYTTGENGVLFSRWNEVKPVIGIFTRVQGRQLPIVSNVDGIFQLDTLVKKS
jgi:hypothetical protein